MDVDELLFRLNTHALIGFYAAALRAMHPEWEEYEFAVRIRQCWGGPSVPWLTGPEADRRMADIILRANLNVDYRDLPEHMYNEVALPGFVFKRHCSRLADCEKWAEQRKRYGLPVKHSPAFLKSRKLALAR